MTGPSIDDQDPRPKPYLSFCIPTYNRAETVHALVQRVLRCPDLDIEVVILDNGSTDDTVQRLATIDDPRVTVRSNGTNRGVLFNVVNVLLHGRGDYCVLLLDKDSVDPDRIGDFKHFLRESSVVCGLSEYDSAANQAPEILPAGLPALRRMGYSCHHPTGYFFDAVRLRALDVKRFVDYELAGHFPLEFLQAELAVQGPVGIYNPKAFMPEDLQREGTRKSVGTNAAKEDAFFSPKGRLKMAVNFSRHILSLHLPAAAQRRLVLDRFYHGLVAATFGYRSTLSDEQVCEHYHISTRRIGTLELLTLVSQYIRGYFAATVSKPDFRGLGLSRSDLLTDVAVRGLRGVARRVARSAA